MELMELIASPEDNTLKLCFEMEGLMTAGLIAVIN